MEQPKPTNEAAGDLITVPKFEQPAPDAVVDTGPQYESSEDYRKRLAENQDTAVDSARAAVDAAGEAPQDKWGPTEADRKHDDDLAAASRRPKEEYPYGRNEQVTPEARQNTLDDLNRANGIPTQAEKRASIAAEAAATQVETKQKGFFTKLRDRLLGP
jgi:hypothetical protein